MNGECSFDTRPIVASVFMARPAKGRIDLCRECLIKAAAALGISPATLATVYGVEEQSMNDTVYHPRTGEVHLGDGCYAYREDGYVVIRVEGNTHNVYLEPKVAAALVAYIERKSEV